MARPRQALWGDVEALHRLVRAGQSCEPSAAAAPPTLPPEAFPPFHDRREFRFHATEAPLTLAGGDYCDAFLLAPETLALVIADVAGKGASAAVVRGVTRSVVRNISPVSDSPADLLTRLARILGEAELGAMFVTICVAWYDTRSGAVRYANAGHPVPLRVTRERRVVPFGAVTGPILGILGSERYTEGRERLEPGERLVLYTDGVTEATSPTDEYFGSLRLTHLLAEDAGTDVERLCERVVRAVARFQGHRREDDVSVLALDRVL